MIVRIWRTSARRIKSLNMLKSLPHFLFMLVGCFVMLSLTGCDMHFIGMLNPKGIVAFQERKLFFDTLALMLIVVLPVIIMSFAFVYHYRASQRTRDYKPNWSHSYFLETIWWTIPCVIILILAIMTWKKTHELDPYNPIAGQTEPPMVIQAIALPWKWLFIYPELNVATVNYVEIPVGRDVEYQITADNTAMSALFIPQLGSQIYAMAGMGTKLHLLANETGVFEGMNTQFSGEGFSDMRFNVHVVTPEEMQQWVKETQKSADHLDGATYTQLLNPTVNNQPQFFSNVEKGLFDNVMMKYMHTFGPVHPRESSLKFHEE